MCPLCGYCVSTVFSTKIHCLSIFCPPYVCYIFTMGQPFVSRCVRLVSTICQSLCSPCVNHESPLCSPLFDSSLSNVFSLGVHHHNVTNHHVSTWQNCVHPLSHLCPPCIPFVSPVSPLWVLNVFTVCPPCVHVHRVSTVSPQYQARTRAGLHFMRVGVENEDFCCCLITMKSM